MARGHPGNSAHGFAGVLQRTGPKTTLASNQNETRHYSETLSKEIALWVGAALKGSSKFHKILSPESQVPTIYGVKSLDVAAVDKRGYLVLDVSIKTFNFKDKKTQNYCHNYTGRFYELLGEELDVRHSYPCATLVALIFLPEDSCFDRDQLSSDSDLASSFGRAVKQFSKVAQRPGEDTGGAHFEHVFVALHDPGGGIYFFDATQPPPKTGKPRTEQQLSFGVVIERIMKTVGDRTAKLASDLLPAQRQFKWG